MGEAKQRQTKPQQSFFQQVTGVLASVKFAVALVGLLTLACVAGTIIPQGADAARYLDKFPGSAAQIAWLTKLGLTRVFAVWWFIGLLGILAASVATCSTRRMATVRRASGYARRRALGSMFTHISILLILSGAVVRAVWGEKGYLEFREGQTVAEFVDDHGVRPLPFGLHLAKFDIETYAAVAQPQPAGQSRGANTDRLLVKSPAQNLVADLSIKLGEEQLIGEGATAFRIRILKYIPDFIIDMATREVRTRSAEPRNPAILVAVAGPAYANQRWLFAKFPDFTMHPNDSPATGPSPLELVYVAAGAPVAKPALEGPIKNYHSTLQVVEGNTVAHEQTIAVNSPMRYKGYTFYQSGYNPRDLSYTSLQVVRDPGVPVVYAGFGFMIVGLFLVFYLNPLLEAGRKHT